MCSANGETWRRFCYGLGLHFMFGVADLVFMDGQMNEEYYLNILKRSLHQSSEKMCMPVVLISTETMT